MIALDIADHFKKKVHPNGFKAQVVAPSRAAALRYAEHLNSFGLRAYPIITSAPNDGPEFKVARELDQEQVVGAFVDPEGEPEVLVVVDMLLTGFDAPVEQVLYLDRALREHGLLQAIARVNRRFSHERDSVPTEKTHGLVVDYHGVSQDLEEALSTFDWPDVQDTMREMDEDPAACRGGGRRPGGVALRWLQPERHLGVRRRLRAGRPYRGKLQGRPVPAVQRGLPACSRGSWTASCPTPARWTTRTGSPGSRKYAPTSGRTSYARTQTWNGRRSARR